MSALIFYPGYALSSAEEADQAEQDGEIHRNKIPGDGEEFQNSGEFGQERAKDCGCVEDGLQDKGAAVEHLSGQEQIGGEHGQQEKRYEPAEQFVADKGETDPAEAGVEDGGDHEKGLEISGADADAAL